MHSSGHGLQIRDNIMDLEANTVIELPDGARWLGLHDTPAQHTFIRPCYSRILEARSEYLAETRYARPEKIIACITGNSGEPACSYYLTGPA